MRNINDPETIKAIGAAAPDYIFVVGWSQICGAEFMQLAPNRVVGYHPAPLPRMRGRAVLPWTILNDEKITGASLFWMDEGVDTGDILEQRFFHVSPRETARTLYDKHMAALGPMIGAALESLVSSSPARSSQDEACATYAARRRPEDGRIDWRCPAEQIDRLVRATTKPYPGAFTEYAGEKLVVWQAQHFARHDHHGVIGQVVEVLDKTFSVITGDGLLRIEAWELEASVPIRKHVVLGRE